MSHCHNESILFSDKTTLVSRYGDKWVNFVLIFSPIPNLPNKHLLSLCLGVIALVFIYYSISSNSDVTGLKFPGFGRAGPDPSGFRAGPGFLTPGFGLFFGLFKIY